jgi:integrase
LREFFGEYRGIEITSDRVTAYVAFRQEQKAANSTINNELAALSRVFTLAMRAGKAAVKPYIGKLEANNTRKGFFEREQFEAVLKHLPEYLKAVTETAYITGWRVHDELLTREKAASNQISGDDEVFAVLAGFTLTTFSLWTLLGG